MGTPAVQALERGWVCFFFRVGLRLRKIEQKVQSSHILFLHHTFSISPSSFPIINILHSRSTFVMVIEPIIIYYY